MESFELYVEKNISNPLRKKELEGTPTYKERLNDHLANLQLNPEDELKLKNLRDANIDPEFIEKFYQSKLKAVADDLRFRYTRNTVDPKKYAKILDVHGVQVFQDNANLTFDLSKDKSKIRIIQYAVNEMIRQLRGLFPVRKPRIIITDIRKQLGTKSIVKTGNDTAGAYYQDRIIYIDIENIDEVSYYVHEMAHYIVDLIPTQTEKLLIKEYEGLLDNYFRMIKKKKRSNLEPQTNTDKDIRDAETMRNKIAAKLGFPSAYGLLNFDEFWAEIITHFNTMPYNKNTYRFKTIAKKVMTRLH